MITIELKLPVYKDYFGPYEYVSFIGTKEINIKNIKCADIVWIGGEGFKIKNIIYDSEKDMYRIEVSKTGYDDISSDDYLCYKEKLLKIGFYRISDDSAILEWLKPKPKKNTIVYRIWRWLDGQN